MHIYSKKAIAYLPFIHSSVNVTKPTVHPKLAQTLVHIVHSAVEPVTRYESEMVITRAGNPYIYGQKILDTEYGSTTRTVTVGTFGAEPKRSTVEYSDLDWFSVNQTDIVFHAVELEFHPSMDEFMTTESYFDNEYCLAVAYERLTGCLSEHAFQGFTRGYRVFDHCSSAVTGNIDILLTGMNEKHAIVELRKRGLKARHEI